MTKKLAIIITAISATIFLVVLFFSVTYSPNDEIVEAKQSTVVDNELDSLSDSKDNGTGVEGKESQQPVSLYIPAIGVNAPVVSVGLSKKGNIASPKGYDDVGWYKYGVSPGEPGTAILDGHVDNGLAQPGVFIDLDKLVIGDHIYISSEEKTTIHFTVSEINVYDFDSQTDDIFVDSVDPSLLLITCTGNWQPLLKTHDKRLIVTAVLLKE